MGILHASYSVDTIRENWNEYRCNPFYIPFAGTIRPDITTEENFNHCMNSMGQQVFGYLLDPLNGLFKDVNDNISELGSGLPLMRGMFTRIRKVMLSFASVTFGKIVNSMSSVSYILIKIRDILKRFAGQGYIATFLVNTGVDFILSFVYLLISIIKSFVYALLAISIILALFQPELLVFAITIASLLGASGY